jgi:hypothetical protein
MADPYGKLSPGQRIEAFPAVLYNAMIDAVRYVERLKRSGAPDLPGAGISQTVIKVRNDSADDLEPGGVLQIATAPVFSAGLEQRRRPIFAGIAPTSTDPAGLVITIDPINSGSIGRAVIAGAVACQVQVGSAAHAFAAPVVGQTDRLLSATSGPLRVLHRESGTGTVWALVSVGAGSTAAGSLAVVRVTDPARDSLDRWPGRALAENSAYSTTDARHWTTQYSGIRVQSLNGVPLIPDDEMHAVYAGTVVDAGSGSGSGDGTVRLYTVDRSRAGFFGFVTSTTQLEDRLYRVKIVRAYPELRLWVVYYATAYARLPGTATPSTVRPYALTFTGRYAPDGSAIPPSRTVDCSGTSHDVSSALSLNLTGLTVQFDDHNGSPTHRTVDISTVSAGALTVLGVATWEASLTGDDGADWFLQYEPCAGAVSISVRGPNATYNLASTSDVITVYSAAGGAPSAFDPLTFSFTALDNALTTGDVPGVDESLTATGSVGEGSGAAAGSGSGPLEELDLFQGDPVCCTPAGSHEWTIVDWQPPVTTCCPGVDFPFVIPARITNKTGPITANIPDEIELVYSEAISAPTVQVWRWVRPEAEADGGRLALYFWCTTGTSPQGFQFVGGVQEPSFLPPYPLDSATAHVLIGDIVNSGTMAHACDPLSFPAHNVISVVQHEGDYGTYPCTPSCPAAAMQRAGVPAAARAARARSRGATGSTSPPRRP